MHPDDEICYCYHVSMRKLVNFAKREKPSVPSRMTECLSAGTGCGWCIPFLVKIADNPEKFAMEHLSTSDYARLRREYLESDSPRNTFDGKTAAVRNDVKENG